ncbi:hypothetical protein BHYA_0304g00090 [Botrytis hyacinthi]|uniref:Uncharacterized protein n=1 Tax=Botrytis hyacinthi TaxID=278943 RepID=A0A4Z1GE16_9HELO|nr:hypothetical protein BHYA_0304g00090 [Botrytis hyacinthi]
MHSSSVPFSFEIPTDLGFPSTFFDFELPHTATSTILPWLGKGKKISYIFLIENATALGKLMVWPEFSKPTHCSTQVETAHSSNLSHQSRTSVGIHLTITDHQESILATCQNIKTERCTRAESRLWATNPYHRLTVLLHGSSANRRKDYESA